MNPSAHARALSQVAKILLSISVTGCAAAGAARAQAVPASSSAPQAVATASAQAASPPVPVPAAVSAAIPSYPDTAKGLEDFIKAMVKAEKKGDRQTVQVYANSLVLPNAPAWFSSVFGDDLGPQYAGASERSRNEITMSASDTIADIITKKRTDVRAVLLEENPCGGTLAREQQLLLRRRSMESFYDVRFSGSRDGMESVWAYFAYAGGGFRYIGNLQASDASPSAAHNGQDAADAPAKPMKMSLKVTEASLIKKVEPQYPDAARMNGIQGTVVFHAIIAKDGAIRSLTLIQGPPILAEAACKAVTQWRYSPTLLQGDPVEVDTVIKVEFTLGGQ